MTIGRVIGQQEQSQGTHAYGALPAVLGPNSLTSVFVNAIATSLVGNAGGAFDVQFSELCHRSDADGTSIF